jgi:pilus assembly protein CpaE
MIPHITLQAFVHSSAARAAMEGAMRDRHMAHANATILPGGIAAAATWHRQNPTPDVLVVEAEHDVLAELPILADVCDPETRVVVIGKANDVTLYKRVMQQGVSEYLVAPVDANGIVVSLRGLYEDTRKSTKGKVYAFVPSRGGAGSSSLSYGVAWLMAAREDRQVMLADLDMDLGSACLALDVQATARLSEAFRDPAQIDAALLDRVLVECGKHLRVLAPSTALVEHDLSPVAVHRLVDIARDGFRHTVLDLPSRWSPAVREALLLADEVVVTALPDLVSLRNTRAILDFLARTRPNDAPPRLVLNQVGQRKRPELAPAAFADALRFVPTTIIRSDAEAFGKAANAGRTLPEVAARSMAARALSRLADGLLDPDATVRPRRRIRLWGRG